VFVLVSRFQFGVDVSQLDSYKQLWDAVTTEDEKAAAL
jgi:hypothetical protein